MAGSNEQPTPAATHWVLDKRLNIAALIGFALSFVGFVWYASQQAARLDGLAITQQDARVAIDKLDQRTGDIEVIKFRMDSVEKTASRIEAKVDALVDRGDR